jgi:hypothetical protein
MGSKAILIQSFSKKSFFQQKNFLPRISSKLHAQIVSRNELRCINSFATKKRNPIELNVFVRHYSQNRDEQQKKVFNPEEFANQSSTKIEKSEDEKREKEKPTPMGRLIQLGMLSIVFFIGSGFVLLSLTVEVIPVSLLFTNGQT